MREKHDEVPASHEVGVCHAVKLKVYQQRNPFDHFECAVLSLDPLCETVVVNLLYLVHGEVINIFVKLVMLLALKLQLLEVVL